MKKQNLTAWIFIVISFIVVITTLILFAIPFFNLMSLPPGSTKTDGIGVFKSDIKLMFVGLAIAMVVWGIFRTYGASIMNKVTDGNDTNEDS